MRPPLESFKGAICRGSVALGTACGACEKCLWEREQLKQMEENLRPPVPALPPIPPDVTVQRTEYFPEVDITVIYGTREK